MTGAGDGMRGLARELASMPMALDAAIGALVTTSADVMTEAARRDMAASASFKGIAPSITSTVRRTATGAWSAEVGPDRAANRAAKLANIAYLGGANGGGGTVAPIEHVLADQEAIFVAGLDTALGRLFK